MPFMGLPVIQAGKAIRPRTGYHANYRITDATGR
jgi:hypothetical protein